MAYEDDQNQQQPAPQAPAPAPKDPNRQVSLDEFEEMARQKYNIPQGLWHSIRSQESGGDVNATSPTGVKGRFQVTEATAKQYGLDRNDPFQQAAAAAKHLRTLYDSQKAGDSDNQKWLGAAARYYAGDSAVNSDGTLSTGSKDGLSNPSRYVEGIARKWGEYNRTDGGSAPTSDTATPTVPPAPQADSAPVRPVTRQPGRQKTYNVGPERQAKPYVTPQQRIQNANQNAFDISNGATGFAAQQKAAQQNTAQVSPEVVAQADAKARFNAQPLSKRVGQFVTNQFAQGGQQAQQTLQNAIGGIGRAGMKAIYGQDPGALDIRSDQGRAAQAATAQRLTQQEQAFPGEGVQDKDASDIALQIAGGALKAAPTMAAITTLGELAGPAAGLAAAGGSTAANADWQNHPVKSALETAGSVALPYVGSKVGGAIVKPIASRVAPGLAGLLTGTAHTVGAGAANAVSPIAENVYEGKPIDWQRAATEAGIGVATGLPFAGAAAQEGRGRANRAAMDRAVQAGELAPTQGQNGTQIQRIPGADTPAYQGLVQEGQARGRAGIGALPQSAPTAPAAAAEAATPEPTSRYQSKSKIQPRILGENERPTILERKHVQTITITGEDGQPREVRAVVPPSMTPEKAAQALQKPAATAPESPATQPEAAAAPAMSSDPRALRQEMSELVREGMGGPKAARAKQIATRIDEIKSQLAQVAPKAKAAPQVSANRAAQPGEPARPWTPAPDPAQRDLQRFAPDAAARGTVGEPVGAPKAPASLLAQRMREVQAQEEIAPSPNAAQPEPVRPVEAPAPELPRRGVAPAPEVARRPLTRQGIPERPVQEASVLPFQNRRALVPQDQGALARPRRVNEPQYAEYQGGEMQNYDRPLAGQPVEQGRTRPMGPQGIRPQGAVRPGSTEGRFGPSTMSAEFPRARRALRFEGERVQGEMDAGRGDKGEYGKLAQTMFKSTRGDVEHGQDSFFHDPDVKGALGLTRDAEQGQVRGALKNELAKVMGVKSDEVSLTQVPPEAWKNWARMKQLGPNAAAKLKVAIDKYQGNALDELQKTQPTPDSGQPRNPQSEPTRVESNPSDFQRFSSANKKAIDALNSVKPEDAATPAGQRRVDALVSRLRKSADQMGVDRKHVDAVVTDAMNAQMEAAKAADTGMTADRAMQNAQARRNAATDAMRGLRPTEESWMTPEEKAALHKERLALPSPGQERLDAQKRVAEKRAARRADENAPAKPAAPEPAAPEAAKPAQRNTPEQMAAWEAELTGKAKPRAAEPQATEAPAKRTRKTKTTPEPATPEAAKGSQIETSKATGLEDIRGQYERTAARYTKDADALEAADVKKGVTTSSMRIRELRAQADEATTRAEAVKAGKHALVEPTAKEDANVTADSRKQKEIPRVGLTPAQADYLRGKVAEVKPKLEGDDSKAVTIRVPDDGQYTVRTPEQADKLIDRMKNPIVSDYKPPKLTKPSANAKMPGDIGIPTKGMGNRDQVEGTYPLEKVTGGEWTGNVTTHKGWVTDGHTMMRTDEMNATKKASFSWQDPKRKRGDLPASSLDTLVEDRAKGLRGPLSQPASIDDQVAVGRDVAIGNQAGIIHAKDGAQVLVNARKLKNIIDNVAFDNVRVTAKNPQNEAIGFFKGDQLQALLMPERTDTATLRKATDLIGESRQPKQGFSLGELKGHDTEGGSSVSMMGLGGAHGMFRRGDPVPNEAKLNDWLDTVSKSIHGSMDDATAQALDEAAGRAETAAKAGNRAEWNKARKQVQAFLDAQPEQDLKVRDRFRSPLSNLNYKGTYERRAGKVGKEISELIRNAQIDLGKAPTEKRGEITRQFRSDAREYEAELRDNNLPGLADALRDHVRFLTEPNHDPLQSVVGKIANFQYNAKLRFNPRSTAVNYLQTYQTLYPFMTFREYLGLLGQATRPENHARLDKVFEGEQNFSVEQADAKRFDPFAKASVYNRRVGYLAGEKFADRAGITGEAKERMALDWAKKVEFDNSKYDIPPVFRSNAAKLLLQFKAFQVKNWERIIADVQDTPPGVVTGKGARIGRMLISQLAVGGVNSLSVPKLLGGVVTIGATSMALQKYAKMDKDKADRLAETVYYGMPALLSQNLSGSTGIFDEPFGDTLDEKLVNTFSGPSVGMAIKGAKEGYNIATAKDTKYGTAWQNRGDAALRLAGAVTPYTKPARVLGSAVAGKLGIRKQYTPTLPMGSDTRPMGPLEAGGFALMGTPVAQGRHYDERDAYDWVKDYLNRNKAGSSRGGRAPDAPRKR